MEEVWKDVVGYEGIYKVSDLGRVKGLDRYVPCVLNGKRFIKGIFLKQLENDWGYLHVKLSRDGKSKCRSVHQLVAESFLGHVPCGHKIVVDHIDFNTKNNKLPNLRLISTRENNSNKKYAGVSKYTGVTWDKSRGKWAARIRIGDKRPYLGRFDSEYEAHLAYQRALSEIQSETI